MRWHVSESEFDKSHNYQGHSSANYYSISRSCLYFVMNVDMIDPCFLLNTEYHQYIGKPKPNYLGGGRKLFDNNATRREYIVTL